MGFESFSLPAPEKKELSQPSLEAEKKHIFSLQEVRELLEQAQRERLRALEEYVKENPDVRRGKVGVEIKREKVRLKNLDIDIIGVAHIPETAVKYSQKIEEKVRESDLLWLEGSRRFLEDREDFLENKTEITESKTTSEAYLPIDTHGFLAFYEYIGLMARKLQKEVLIADPVETDEAAIFRLDSEIPLLAGTAALTAYAASDLVLRKEVSRRTFLKLGGAAALLYAGNRLGVSNLMENDYRNIAVAHAIHTVDKMLKEKEKKMTVIYGAIHLPRLKFWLEHPEELQEAFKEASLIDTIFSPPELRAYRYVPTPEETVTLPNGKVDMATAGSWKKTLDIRI